MDEEKRLTATSTLDLALIGNSSVGALIDGRGDVVWGCFPRFDSDALFCSLLCPRAAPGEIGSWRIELLDLERTEQEYLPNTPVLVTRLIDRHGGVVELTDFAPRFRQYGRMFCPIMLARRVRRAAGSPRICVRLRPAADYGASLAARSYGSNHVRYVTPGIAMRVTTDASITALVEERPFFLEQELTFLFGPDETVQGAPADVGHRFLEETVTYWREWVRYLGIPFEWQDAVIRAAISLKLNAYDDTGAIVAAMTTSIPESRGSARNWDYRFCWLRDGYFVVNALNRLGATRTMERYLSYIINIAAGSRNGRLQPCYRLDGAGEMEERELASLQGFLGMGPVRVGNQAYVQVQNDAYGSAILAATHVFFDRRLLHVGGQALFHRLEALGEVAAQVFDQPDAGLWELRGGPRVHTFSAVMCWVACDRLARIAAHLGLAARAAYWREHAQRLHRTIAQRAWSERRACLVATFEGDDLDASLLLLHELRFLAADDPRFRATVDAVGAELKRGDFLFRYSQPDDFGVPENAFVVCTFWYIDALAALGRKEQARALFETMLACRNRHGLLAEHLDVRTRELWGNFVQTYSMVGLINSAMRLSIPWEQAF
jgi:GH15 family glucan-1,4-alpha-glucosidase